MIREDVIYCSQIIVKIAREKGEFVVSKDGSKKVEIVVSVKGEEGFITEKREMCFTDFPEDVRKEAIDYAKKYYKVKVVR